jgi:hypothetical protein
VTFHLRRKAACRFAVTGAALHPSTLTCGRWRLTWSSRPDRILEGVADVVDSNCVVAGKMLQALDSAVLDDAVDRPGHCAPADCRYPAGRPGGA